jgi:hypothetical protein
MGSIPITHSNFSRPKDAINQRETTMVAES